MSDGLDRLIYFVPSLAQVGLKQIIFFHSVPLWEEGEIPRVDEGKIETAKSTLSRALQSVPKDIEVKVEVASGRPIDTIPRVLASCPIDVVIVGTPIRSALEEKIFGSTTMELAKLTAKPLMIFRPQLISTYTTEELTLRCEHLWRYLLIPYNDSTAAHYQIEQIKGLLANSNKAIEKCLLCWVVEDKGRREIAPEYFVQEARAKLEVVKQDLTNLGLEVEMEVRLGNPLQEILNTALTHDISAIAMGGDRRSSLLQWTVPSVANELLRRSWFPILFFGRKNKIDLYRTYAETGFLNQNSGFGHFIPTPNPVSRLVGVSPIIVE